MKTYLGSEDFTKHSENFRTVRKGLTQVERLHKDAIRRRDESATDTIARLHYFMIGLLAEAHLRKIIGDPNGFNGRERSTLARARSKLDQWTLTVELAFRRHYSIPLHLEVDDGSARAGVADQLALLNDLLTKDLAPVIEDRNKTAHSQWAWHLNSKETGFVGPARPPLNYSELFMRTKLIIEIGNLVNVLTLSEWTFQRDFNAHMQKIGEAQRGLDGRFFGEFVRRLRAKADQRAGPTE